MVVVGGSWRSFWAEDQSLAPDAVWRCWTDPATWGEWDRGLSSASLDGPFTVGAVGELVDTAGRRSPFKVQQVDEGRCCRVRVRLPAAGLVLERTLEPGANDAPWTTVRHEVRFVGPLGPVFAVVLGRRFRHLLPPTLEALVGLTEEPSA